jgi:hypothetical protein
MEVHLPALLCIAPQLRHLHLPECCLHAECSPTEFFASGWDRLQELNLCDSTVNASIGAVRLPWLEKLDIEMLAVESPGIATSEHVSALRLDAHGAQV